MERNSSPRLVAPKTETALRRTGRVAHKVAKAGMVARKKLAAISIHVKALRRQLQENTEGLSVTLGHVSQKQSGTTRKDLIS